MLILSSLPPLWGYMLLQLFHTLRQISLVLTLAFEAFGWACAHSTEGQAPFVSADNAHQILVTTLLRAGQRYNRLAGDFGLLEKQVKLDSYTQVR